MTKPLLVLLLAVCSHAVFSQNLTDGLMMKKNLFCTGLMYSNDQWEDYWEGTLERDNGNIGKIRTQSLMWGGVYGITDKINVIAMVPYMKIDASEGTLHEMKGLQDLSIGVKYNFFQKNFEKSSFNTFAVFNFSTPLSDYSPDFFPLSLGTQTTNLSYRLTANFRIEQGWFINASGAYTWRSNTTLDREGYYDGDEYILSDEVEMPNVFDVFVSLGYLKGPLQAELQYIQMNTLGGSDITRQGMPFVSNRMNFIKTGVLVMYYPPFVKNLAVRGGYTTTLAGRNVGDSNTFMLGAFYTFNFSREKIQSSTPTTTN
ncbi:MAG TPA: hypothetical protein VGK59_11375 [Ohtaekwangia sp.]